MCENVKFSHIISYVASTQKMLAVIMGSAQGSLSKLCWLVWATFLGSG